MRRITDMRTKIQKLKAPNSVNAQPQKLHLIIKIPQSGFFVGFYFDFQLFSSMIKIRRGGFDANAQVAKLADALP
jgi:hypothetical protein